MTCCLSLAVTFPQPSGHRTQQPCSLLPTAAQEAATLPAHSTVQRLRTSSPLARSVKRAAAQQAASHCPHAAGAAPPTCPAQVPSPSRRAQGQSALYRAPVTPLPALGIAHTTRPRSACLLASTSGPSPGPPTRDRITGTELQAEAASRQASDAKGKGGAGLGVSLQNFRATASVTLEGSCHLQHFGVSLSLEAPNFGGPFESRRQHMTH